MAEPRLIDEMLSRVASAHPRRIALRAPYGDITYRELDGAVTSCAAALRGLLGPGRHVVALASPLHPDYVTGFYGTVRSRNIVAPINPLLPEAALEHLLAASGAELVFVTTELFARLRPIRHRLPQLREAVLVGPGSVVDASDIRTIDDLSAAYEVKGFAMAPPPIALDDVACIQFTSGTTGEPRGVQLTHRNLVVNAAQVAEAHELDGDSVVLNHLPKFHLMHMNSAIYAGATQVPCASPDTRDAIELANRTRATHFYTIPMLLNRLAAHPDLAELRFDTVRTIGSGGSPLAPRIATRLTGHFGIPVFQGYGLAEASPITHSAGPSDPRPGTVGPPVTGTECRIVDPQSRAVLPAGSRGEVQVRGPQVMRGYLDPQEVTGIDSDGWLSTGDIGYQDEDGVLVLVDRINDFFKCDNYLVSPTEIERVAEEHPYVRECVVVGYPDELSGCVPVATVTLAAAARARPRAQVAAALVAYTAERLPHYQHLRHVEVVPTIPRNANGKVQRAYLRAELITRRELSDPEPRIDTKGRNPEMADETPDLSNLIAVIARFSTKGDPKDFEKFFLEHVEWMRAQEGFGSHQAVRLAADPSVYLNFGWWLSSEAFQKVVQSAEFRSHQGTMRAMLEDAFVDVNKNLFRVNADQEAGERSDFATPLMNVTTYRLRGPAEAFETAFATYAKEIRKTYGFGYADLNRSVQTPGTYTGIGYWWDPAAYERVIGGEAYRALAEYADIRVEPVVHVAWNRALGAEDEHAATATAG